MGDSAIATDDEGGSLGSPVGAVLPVLLNPGSVEVGDLVVLVGEQGKLEPILLGESRDGWLRVRRDPDHHGLGPLVLGRSITDAAGLSRAAGRVRPRVEVENHRSPAQVRERHVMPVLVRQREVRGRLAFAHHRPGPAQSSGQKSSCLSVSLSPAVALIEQITTSVGSSRSLWTDRKASLATRTAVLGPALNTSSPTLKVNSPLITR